MTAPRLHVIPAAGCDLALVLRRGPARYVASLLWNRATGAVELGQWLRGRIYEHRSDLSPDGRHMIVFAGNGKKWWTAISRAPWLTAIAFYPQSSTWHGGGAFTAEGRVFFNGGAEEGPLPDGLKAAPADAFPHGTDGFHMGGLYPAMMALRGWSHVEGTSYETILEKPAAKDWRLRLGFEIGRKDRAIISNRYALVREGDRRDMPDWEWAEHWGAGLQIARAGALWQVPLDAHGPGEPELIHDFGETQFEARPAPYDGIRQ